MYEKRMFQVPNVVKYLLFHARFQQHHHTCFYGQSNLSVTAFQMLLQSHAKRRLLRPGVCTAERGR